MDLVEVNFHFHQVDGLAASESNIDNDLDADTMLSVLLSWFFDKENGMERAKMITLRLNAEDAEMFDEAKAWMSAIWPALRLNDAEVMRCCLREMHAKINNSSESQQAMLDSLRQQETQKKVSKRLKKLADDQGVS